MLRPKTNADLHAGNHHVLGKGRTELGRQRCTDGHEGAAGPPQPDLCVQHHVSDIQEVSVNVNKLTLHAMAKEPEQPQPPERKKEARPAPRRLLHPAGSSGSPGRGTQPSDGTGS